MFGRGEAIHRARAHGYFLSAGGTLMGRDYFDTNIKAADQSEIRAHVTQTDGTGGHRVWLDWVVCFCKKKRHIFDLFEKSKIFIFSSLFCFWLFRLFRLIFYSLIANRICRLSFIVVSGDYICVINSCRHTGNASLQGFFMCGGISHFWHRVWCLSR